MAVKQTPLRRRKFVNRRNLKPDFRGLSEVERKAKEWSRENPVGTPINLDAYWIGRTERTYIKSRAWDVNGVIIVKVQGHNFGIEIGRCKSVVEAPLSEPTNLSECNSAYCYMCKFTKHIRFLNPAEEQRCTCEHRDEFGRVEYPEMARNDVLALLQKQNLTLHEGVN